MFHGALRLTAEIAHACGNIQTTLWLYRDVRRLLYQLPERQDPVTLVLLRIVLSTVLVQRQKLAATHLCLRLLLTSRVKGIATP